MTVKVKKIKRPTFTELDIGMKNPDKKSRSPYQKKMYENKHGKPVPMTPMEEAGYLRAFGTKFIQSAGPKSYKSRANYGTVDNLAAKNKGSN